MVKHTLGGDQKIISYLLNELSPEDQGRFEEAYFGDENLFEQVQAMEEELIDDYVKGNLSSHESRLFERHYLATDERRVRIKAARQLVELFSLKSEAQSASNSAIKDGRNKDSQIESWVLSVRSRAQSLAKWPLIPIFGVSAAILLLLVSVLAVELFRLRGRLEVVSEGRVAVEQRAQDSERRLASERGQLAEERKQNADLMAKLENRNSQSGRLNQGPRAMKKIVSLPLTEEVRGLGKSPRAVLSDSTEILELRVELDAQDADPRRAYRAVVEASDGGKEIWARDGIKLQRRKSAQYVVVRAPADRFKAAGAQDFILTLSRLTAGDKNYEVAERFYFEVITH
ncbi:MAG: hypothetical protein J2P21_00225 [Chloracidobacterium sp.]|nr:hypothetical protein [Chloracidobacterium sp.]